MTQLVRLMFHFSLYEAILFRHLIKLDYILYMALNPIYRVSNELIYTAVIVFNVIRTIRQSLIPFNKPGMYRE